jgi:integrase
MSLLQKGDGPRRRVKTEGGSVRGHVYRRGETWTYVVDVGHDATGRRRQTSKGGFPTKKEAQTALNVAINALQQGTYVEPTAITVDHFLRDRWLPAAKGTIRPTTYSSYEMHVRCYLAPAFGHLRLQQVTPLAINAFYGELLKGWNGRAALSPATVRRIHATLHRALRDAVRWQLIVRNPAGAADPPRARRPDMKVWTPAQLHVFLSDAADDRHFTLWLFYILTGVRRGEALALRWSDVDLAAGTAAIRRSLVPVDHGLVFGEPKTDRGRRLIGIDMALVAALRQHWRHQATERLRIGVAFDEDDLVFAHADGRPLHPERVSRWFSKVVGTTGAPPIRLHDLRHLHATLALAAGVAPRVLADRLGHSTTAVTTDTYQHVLPDLDHDAARRVAELVFPDPSAPTTEQGSAS